MSIKKMLFAGIIVAGVAATGVTALAAANYQTPAQAVAGLTDRTVESVVEQRQETGMTYGQMAAEAGVLPEFKQEVLEIKKETIAERVEEGKLTPEQGEAIVEKLEQNNAVCDGTGTAAIGQQEGIGFGGGNGGGQNRGQQAGGGNGGGQNRGQQAGAGQGGTRGQNGLRDASCVVE